MPRRGFSLIELLVVITIIAVMVSLLLPALSGAMDRVRLTRCLANCQQAGVALGAYAGDNRSTFPAVPVPAGMPSTPNQHMYGRLAGFFSLNQIGDGSHAGFTGGAYANGAQIPVLHGYLTSLGSLRCPSDREDRYYGMPYGPSGTTAYSAAETVRPEPLSGEADAVSYNISYFYFTGQSAAGGSHALVWADETNGPDIDDLAWYGPGPAGSSSPNSVAAGAAGVGRYSRVDNHGNQGGNFASSDGGASFWKGDRFLPPGSARTCVD